MIKGKKQPFSKRIGRKQPVTTKHYYLLKTRVYNTASKGQLQLYCYADLLTTGQQFIIIAVYLIQF
jgi:hypothetical protein